MPGPIFKTLSLDELTQQTALRSKPQGSNSTYLASVAVVAGVIIGLFFGIGFSLLVPEQIIIGSGTGNRSPEVKLQPQPVSLDLEHPPPPAVSSSQRIRARRDIAARCGSARGAHSEIVTDQCRGAGRISRTGEPIKINRSTVAGRFSL